MWQNIHDVIRHGQYSHQIKKRVEGYVWRVPPVQGPCLITPQTPGDQISLPGGSLTRSLPVTVTTKSPRFSNTNELRQSIVTSHDSLGTRPLNIQLSAFYPLGAWNEYVVLYDPVLIWRLQAESPGLERPGEFPSVRPVSRESQTILADTRLGRKLRISSHRTDAFWPSRQPDTSNINKGLYLG
jgi:hypothetical protein